MAAVLGLLGLLFLLLLMVVMGEVEFGWVSWLKARMSEWRSQGPREVSEGSEVVGGPPDLNVDLRR